MALTKADMAERLFLDVGLNKREAKEFVDAFFESIREALEKGEQVKLSGCCTSRASPSPARVPAWKAAMRRSNRACRSRSCTRCAWSWKKSSASCVADRSVWLPETVPLLLELSS
jgi:hypothetical protein